MCERAIDPLEIAAGIEAAGITDRTAARFRHRDVFSLAEEMYARAARGSAAETAPATAHAAERAHGGRGAWAPTAWMRGAWASTGRFLLALLPGGVGALTLTGLWLTSGWARLGAVAVGLLATTAALGAALRYGPLRAMRRTGLATRVWTCVLVGYALCGDGLLAAARRDGGPGVLAALRRTLTSFRAPAGATGVPWPFAAHGSTGAPFHWYPPAHTSSWYALWHTAPWSAVPWQTSAGHGTHPLDALAASPVLALALAVVPALGCARLFAVGVRYRVADSRGTAQFTASARPLLVAVCVLFLWALGVLLTVCAALLHQDAGYAGAGALGLLLMLAGLLRAHGFTRAPAVLLGAAGAAELLAVGIVCAARLPGCAWPAARIEDAIGALGPGIVPATACSAAALALLAHALRTLTRPSSHLPRPDHPGPRHPAPRPRKHHPQAHQAHTERARKARAPKGPARRGRTPEPLIAKEPA